MSLEELKSELLVNLDVSPEDTIVETNRYNRNIGRVIIPRRISHLRIKYVLGRFYSEVEGADGVYYITHNGDSLLANVSSDNGQTEIEISRNHFFDLTL